MQTSWTQQQDLGRAIKTVIDDYISGHRTRSLATLARQSGVSYSTLRRMAQKEGTPTAEPVLKIIDVALDGKSRGDFLARFFPEISRSVGLLGVEGATNGESNSLLKPYYSREPHGLILLLAQNQCGTNIETVSRLCGEPGLQAVSELINEGLIAVEEGTDNLSLLSGSSIHLDASMILNCMRTAISRFDHSLLGTEAARIGHISGGISLEGLSQIRQVVTDALAEIVAIKENTRFYGNIPFFCDMLLNVFDRSAFIKESQPVSNEDSYGIH